MARATIIERVEVEFDEIRKELGLSGDFKHPLESELWIDEGHNWPGEGLGNRDLLREMQEIRSSIPRVRRHKFERC